MKLYHTTNKERLSSILKEGLKINSLHNKTADAGNYIQKAYGMIPVFLSAKPGRYKNGIILEVDVRGLPLVSDIPSLVDHDGYVSNNLQGIYWDEMIDDPKADLIYELGGDEGEISFEALTRPNSKEVSLSIAITETCAIMQDIGPNRIKIFGSIKESKSDRITTAKKFLDKIKAKDPELYDKLIDNADWFLKKYKNDYSAKDLKTVFKAELVKEPELDPSKSPDTYGIKLAIDAVAGKDKKEATAAKRLFGNTLDQIFKEELTLAEDAVFDKATNGWFYSSINEDEDIPDAILNVLEKNAVKVYKLLQKQNAVSDCGIASSLWKKVFNSNNIAAEEIDGNYDDSYDVDVLSHPSSTDHVWLELNGKYIFDPTAGQFNSNIDLKNYWIDDTQLYASENVTEANYYHMSHAPVKKIDSIKPNNQMSSTQKPEGFWYSCEHEWLDWVRAEMPHRDDEHYYNIKLNYDNILQISNFEELLAFSEEYGIGKEFCIAIDWKRVAKKYAGIEICPYQDDGRYEHKTLWYHPWDVASGCIWNKKAVLAIEPASKPLKQAEQELMTEEYSGFGGTCGVKAIELNKKLFDGKGTYVAGLNDFWLEEGRWVGHIAVKFKDKYYDASGEISEEDLRSWGMTDPEDPDYNFSSNSWWGEEDAYEASLHEVSESEILENMGYDQCDTLREEEWRRGGVRFFQMGDTLNPALKDGPAIRKKPLGNKKKTNK